MYKGLDMTTVVIVKCPNPNHNEVIVEKVGINVDGSEPVESVHLRKGEERTFYVHTHQFLRIKEVLI